MWPVNKDGNRSKYTGAWVEGKMNGEGQFTNEHGEVHKGLFVNNLFVLQMGGLKYFLSPFDTKDSHVKTIK